MKKFLHYRSNSCLVIAILLLLMSACSTSRDYRTDREIAEGVILTEEVIELRKAQEDADKEWWNRRSIQISKEMEMNRMTHCHTGNYLDCVR